MNVARLTRRKNGTRRRGAAAIEFALVAPAMFTILFASFELVRIQLIQGMTNVASYEAARHVMVPGAKVQEAIDMAREKLNGLSAVGAEVEITVNGKNGVQAEIDDKTRSVTVSIELPMDQNTFLLSLFFVDRTIWSETTLTFESYDGFYDGSSY